MITLASKRYTIAAYNNTLDSRYPLGAAVVWSVEGGLLTATVGVGTASVSARWDAPTTNADASLIHDLKTFRVYAGTATGLSDLINGVDISTTPQPGATHLVVAGLAANDPVYLRVKAIDSEGNESSESTEQSFTAAEPAAAPGSWTDIGQADLPYTITANGNYRLSENVSLTSGTVITINGSLTNVVLNGNRKTVTFRSSGIGIGVSCGNGSVVDIYGFDFTPGNYTGGSFSRYTGSCIYHPGGSFGAGSKIHDNTLSITTGATDYFALLLLMGINDTAGRTGNAVDGNGLKIYGNTCSTSGVARNGCGVYGVKNARIYGNTFSVYDTPVGVYFGLFEYCHGTEIFGNTIHLDETCLTDPTAMPGSDGYMHDNSITCAGNGARLCIVNGTGAAGYDARIFYNWNTITVPSYAAMTNYSRLFRMRYGGENLSVGFNTIDASAAPVSTGNSVLASFGGADASGSLPPTGMYVYHNTIDTTGWVVESYGNDSTYGQSSGLYVWGNAITTRGTAEYLRITGNHATAESPTDFRFNSNTHTKLGTPATTYLGNLPSGITLTDWTSYQSFASGDCDADLAAQVTFAGSWQGFNPASDTPSAPSNLRAI